MFYVQDCQQGCWDVNQAYSGSIGMFYGYNREATQSDVSALYVCIIWSYDWIPAVGLSMMEFK